MNVDGVEQGAFAGQLFAGAFGWHKVCRVYCLPSGDESSAKPGENPVFHRMTHIHNDRARFGMVSEPHTLSFLDGLAEVPYSVARARASTKGENKRHPHFLPSRPVASVLMIITAVSPTAPTALLHTTLSLG